MATRRSFKEYVANRYDNEIYDSINDYLIRNKNRLNLRLYNVERIDFVDLQTTRVKRVYANDLPGSEISFDILVEACFTVTQYDNRYGEQYEDTTMWFKFSGRGDLNKNLDDVKLSYPVEYAYKPKRDNPLDDSLVPYISKEKYDDTASEFLKAAGYETALTTPTYIDSRKVAEAFGLDVINASLSSDDSVFGRVFFCDDNATVYDGITGEPKTISVKAGTILFDPFAHFMKTCGGSDSTIIHECFHWYKHKKAYELERLLNESTTSIGCMVVGGVEDDRRESTAWMERQANAITPRIQMPLISLKIHVANMMTKYKRKGYQYPDILEPIIDEVATYFHVSRTAAKIRMIDAGFEEAAGTFNYIDGRYIPVHSWKQGSIKINQTFCIDTVSAVIESYRSHEFRELLESGKYEYIDSHFVLRSPKYIKVDEEGNHHMTDYARYHMDECALVFDLSIRNGDVYGDSYHTECFLNKDKHSPFEFDYKFHGELALETKEEQEKYVNNYLQRAVEVANTFTRSFPDNLKKCKDFSGISFNDIADRINKDERQVRKIFSGESNGSFESIVAIIFALEIPPILSMPLMDTSPHPFVTGNQKHMFVKTIMHSMYGHRIDEVKDVLLKQNIKIIDD